MVILQATQGVSIQSSKTHHIGEENVIYIKGSEDFFLSLKTENQTKVLAWTREDTIKNDERTYKLIMTYTENFREGKYSLVAENKTSITTKDIEIKHIGLWKRVKNFIEEIYKALVFNS